MRKRQDGSDDSLMAAAMRICANNIGLARQRFHRVMELARQYEPYITGLNEREKSAAANQTNIRRYGNEQQH